MSETLIVAGWIVKGVADRHTAEVIRDGALYQRDGVIVEIGDAQQLIARYPNCCLVSSTATITSA
jgi:5-methylthioadenosine/S-adenosylhomocysteine deaminase